MSSTKARVRDLLAEHLGPAAVDGIGDNDTPWKDAERRYQERMAAGNGAPGKAEAGDLDSLDKLEFIMACEEEFGVEIVDEVASRLDSIQDIADHIDLLLASKGAGNHGPRRRLRR